MAPLLKLGDITVEVTLKDIKHVHLTVHPPTGRVRISAPARMSQDTIHVFAVSKLGWIKKQQEKLQAQERETRREYLERESHYVWGKRYLLKLVECDAPPSVELTPGQMILRVRPGADEAKRQAIVEEWYRRQLKQAAPPLIARWEQLLGVKAERLFVQRMKTRWGSCNPKTRSIRLNSDLAKKPRECLEHVIVHELAHLLEPSHNHRFVAIMDRFMPNWREVRAQLNRLPVSHEDWGD